jgi:hypothetical protein
MIDFSHYMGYNEERYDKQEDIDTPLNLLFFLQRL